MTDCEKLTFTEMVEKMRQLQIACEDVRYLDRALNEKRHAYEKKVDLLISQIRIKMRQNEQRELFKGVKNE